jgi:putative oxidoreductase
VSFRTSLGPNSDLIFRALFSLIFVVAGLGHFAQHDAMLARMQAGPFFEVLSMLGPPSLMLWASGAVLLAAGVALLVGFRARWAALALLLTLIPITVTVHLAPGHAGPLFKNIALAGGLIHFAVRGAGAWSLDVRASAESAT